MAAACPARLRAAQDETASSDAFRQLCRELVWRVEHRGDGGAGFGALSPAARALLERRGQMVVDGGSAGQFEALLSAQLDLSLSRAVTAARLEGEERGGGSASVVELIEAEASAGILALLEGCPGERPGRAPAAPGPAPARAPGALWRARLRDEAAATTFRDLRRRGVATISPFADITARCAEILGPRDFGADGLRP
ncbi:hypothetical protein JL720_7784 [Aureococcus anophagefferens]|nr:hypothetical protein JL720_7784 [Aureococcus anophagefferens]